MDDHMRMSITIKHIVFTSPLQWQIYRVLGVCASTSKRRARIARCSASSEHIDPIWMRVSS
ncbi:protein of unknown function [Thauera humireducens]|nr:protein of unknown function [Thauera humireducens]